MVMDDQKGYISIMSNMPWPNPSTNHGSPPIPLVTPAPERGLYATGHHNIVNIPGTDEWIIAYHRFAFDASESSQTPESVVRDTQRGQLERGEMDMGALGRHRFAGFETNRQILGQSVAFHNIGFSYQAATNRFCQMQHGFGMASRGLIQSYYKISRTIISQFHPIDDWHARHGFQRY